VLGFTSEKLEDLEIVGKSYFKVENRNIEEGIYTLRGKELIALMPGQRISHQGLKVGIAESADGLRLISSELQRINERLYTSLIKIYDSPISNNKGSSFYCERSDGLIDIFNS